MYESFSKNEAVLDVSKEEKPGNGARQMLTKIVNSLSSKMEIGTPMAALYLLQNPDHYTSHQFIPFYWKNYFNYVQGQWKALLDIAEPVDDDLDNCPEDVGISRTGHNDEDPSVLLSKESSNSETVQMGRANGCFLAKTNTDDYRHRPLQHEGISVYDFVQCSIKHPIRSSRPPRRDLRWCRLHPDHPQYETHVLALDPERRTMYVPHFIGPSLPRRDTGDREEYCCAMLTLFCPWRSGIDLKSSERTWEETFNQYPFSERQKTLMNNFNMRYECYDARDDYNAITRTAGKEGSGNESDDDEDEGVFADNGENIEDDDEYLEMGLGRAAASLRRSNEGITQALRAAGWKAYGMLAGAKTRAQELPRIAIDRALRSGAWNNIIKVEKLRAWRRKMGTFLAGGSRATGDEGETLRSGEVRNDVYVVSSAYLSKDYKPTEEKWVDAMDRVILKFHLNQGQEKAFRIIANHACSIGPDQLLMHLGGMGGTGKSTVIRSL
ncbi:hypothetical protein DFP72DRAFT_762659, partial [Ephemerocybe angulata]